MSGYISPSNSLKDKARVTVLEAGQHPRESSRGEELRKFGLKSGAGLENTCSRLWV